MSLPRSSRRRSSVVDDENITKLLLAAKTQNIISKRRGSAVSIDSIPSNSVVMIDATITTLPSNSSDSSKMFYTPPSQFSVNKDDTFSKVVEFNEKDRSSSRTLSQHLQQQQQFLHVRSLSQPIPSFSQQRPLVQSANYDNHNQYKIRTELSSKKLYRFFGDKPPIDICVKEIEREGLKAMLHSKIPLCYFLYSLLEEFSCENLFFFLEVEQFESFEYSNLAQQYTIAQHIFDTYLTRNSQFEINIDDKVRKSVISFIKSQRDLRHCFDDAKRAVYVLLESSFARFIRSSTADLMKKEIGEKTTHYSIKSRDSAISLLLTFFDRQQHPSSQPSLVAPYSHSKNKPFVHYNPPSNSHVTPPSSNSASPIPSPTSMASRRRIELIRSMIYEFIRTLLEVEIENFLHDPSNYDLNSLSGSDHDTRGTNGDEPLEQLPVIRHRKSGKEPLRNPFSRRRW
ncbi:17689_t:CDS:2 [Dentiscutata erythropus]|uniref:17689_t:CDS:1 n=1 Tax=Dentiscutata erythropus TaxID=1348616 RepID=A0A9N9NSH2_9GLOM|nr:17689_t:CDS:2 [Dentiscutata erythropus]